jgi:tetratricopeptide (TPR) repeat protein
MAAPKSQERPAGWNGNGAVFGVCALLAAAVLLVFGQTLRHGFINCDDGPYVYDNPHVVKGLTLAGIVWAFTHSHAGFWHPLTWISHMLDCQLYGLNAGGHHLTNVLLHMATTILLFLVLRQMTGLRQDKAASSAPADTLWPSAFVAAVFAIHPLRVESVAWVAERKDILSGLFFMLTLLMYARYAQNCAKSQVSGVRWLRSCDYWLAVLFFALGLMSKPMLVTVPFVLLLLDYWPLRRFVLPSQNGTSQLSTPHPVQLVLEKLPLFLLAIAAGFVAFLTQKSDGAVATLEGLPLGSRLANGLVSYVTYILKMFWPDNLAIFYPYPAKVPTWEIAVAGALLLFGTMSAVMFARRRPYLLVGWLWYLGMLVPVIGLVQVGDQAWADRFTYLPQIGLYLVVVWAIKDLAASWRWRRQVLDVAAFSVIAALMACSWKQTSYWRNDESLWGHTLACTSGNYLAHNYLGYWLVAQGRTAEALEHYQKALEINPYYPDARNNLGTLFLNQGRIDEAINQFKKALEIEPNYLNAHYNLGNALLEVGRIDEAIVQFRRALEIKPDDADTYYNLGVALMRVGRSDEAIGCFQKVIEFKPDSVGAYNNLALVLFTQGKFNEAIKEYQRTLELMPNYADAHYMLGCALQGQRKFDAAIVQFQEVLKLEPGHVMAQNSLAWLLATCPEASLRDGGKAIELAKQAEQLSGGNHPEILDTLAAAYAEAGRYPEAVETARRALSLIATQNNKLLADALQMRLKLYEANAPFHEKP